MADFGGARKWARSMVQAQLTEGAAVVDATMGNGYDTQWLAECVGETGRVYAFDVQQAALDATRARLEACGLADRVRLILDGHQHMANHVREAVDAVVFNLGWLPGTPHECTTHTETTMTAVEQALSLLKPGGVMTVCVYPGHEEGTRELETLTDWAQQLSDATYDAVIWKYANIRKRPPVLIAVTRRK